jgi:hypothetical protein
MIQFLMRILGVSGDGMDAMAAPRSSAWRSIRKKHLENNPRCEACGARERVVPHHIVPVHVDPSRELDPQNLVSLCESRTFNCHLFFGHLKRWDRHNPRVLEDARTWRARIQEANDQIVPEASQEENPSPSPDSRTISM